MKRKVVNPNPQEKKLKQKIEKQQEKEMEEELIEEISHPPTKEDENHSEKMQHS